MTIEEHLLTINEYSRPGTRRRQTLGLVMHWTANPHANALANVRYFENRKTGTAGYGSAHYVIGQDGTIIRCIPEWEVAYHCGSSQVDPVSLKVYTDLARKLFSDYCYKSTSPNLCTIGVELCPTDAAGHFADATLEAAVELAADIMVRYKLKSEQLVTHHDVVGWKDCPRLWVKQPELFGMFKLQVADMAGKMAGLAKREETV